MRNAWLEKEVSWNNDQFISPLANKYIILNALTKNTLNQQSIKNDIIKQKFAMTNKSQNTNPKIAKNTKTDYTEEKALYTNPTLKNKYNTGAASHTTEYIPEPSTYTQSKQTPSIFSSLHNGYNEIDQTEIRTIGIENMKDINTQGESTETTLTNTDESRDCRPTEDLNLQSVIRIVNSKTKHNRKPKTDKNVIKILVKTLKTASKGSKPAAHIHTNEPSCSEKLEKPNTKNDHETPEILEKLIKFKQTDDTSTPTITKKLIKNNKKATLIRRKKAKILGVSQNSHIKARRSPNKLKGQSLITDMFKKDSKNKKINSSTTDTPTNIVDLAQDTFSLEDSDQPIGTTSLKTSITNQIITDNENSKNTEHPLNKIKTTPFKNKSIIHKNMACTTVQTDTKDPPATNSAA